MVFRFRAVFAALSPLRCASGPAGAHRFFALSPLRSTVGLVFPRSGRGAVFAFFFEPSRVSEALCRRQEPREGVPKRARACERGGEARRREPRGRLTTTYRTINARLPPDCERLLIFNFFSLKVSLFPEKRHQGAMVRLYGEVSLSGPLFATLSSLRCASGFAPRAIFLRSVFAPVTVGLISPLPRGRFRFFL